MAGEPLTASAVPAGPTPFVATTPLPDGINESALRAAAMEAERTGQDVVALPATQTPQVSPDAQAPAIPQPTPAPITPVPSDPSKVPQKFMKPDGTVDVEKLQASTEQLRAGIQEKVLTIDEMVNEYKELEKQFHGLPRAPEQVAALAQQVAAQPAQTNPPAAAQDPQAIQAQLVQALNADPLGTIVDIVRTVTKQETQPMQQFVQSAKETERTNFLKSTIAEVAKQDPRVLNGAIYQEIVNEIKSDPGYLNLKNPYKAAWNEVKARLRLGDAPTPAQPGKTASPILGGGSPPPVPSTSAGVTQQTVSEAIKLAQNPTEMNNVEAELRKMAQVAQW